jgi:hypothetical protein
VSGHPTVKRKFLTRSVIVEGRGERAGRDRLTPNKEEAACMITGKQERNVSATMGPTKTKRTDTTIDKELTGPDAPWLVDVRNFEEGF